MNKPKAHLGNPLLLILLIGITCVSCQRKASSVPYIKDTGLVFGTEYHITYQSSQNLHDGITMELEKVDQSLSTFNPRSTLSRLNQNASDRLDRMTEQVIRQALEISSHTHGAFDITVAPLVNAWGFGFKNHPSITKTQIDSILRYVGYDKIAIQNHRLHKRNPEIQLDCSAIAKGFACDVIARYLKKHKVTNFLIEIGGEIYVQGISPSRQEWNIGISRPQEDSTGILVSKPVSVIKITDTGMATSGNYRNFYYKNGRKYAHIIDPHTGYPVQHSILSATVIAPTCTEADAYATAFMVLGMEKSKEILERQKYLKACLIYTDSRGRLSTWFTPNLKEKI